VRKWRVTRKTTLTTDRTTGAHVGSGGTHSAAASAVAQRKRNLTPILGRRIAVELSRRAGLLAGSGDTVRNTHRALVARGFAVAATVATVTHRRVDISLTRHTGRGRNRVGAYAVLKVDWTAHVRALPIGADGGHVGSSGRATVVVASAAAAEVVEAFASASAAGFSGGAGGARAAGADSGFATVGGVSAGAAIGTAFAHVGRGSSIASAA
jgi:hypothetical protein